MAHMYDHLKPPEKRKKRFSGVRFWPALAAVTAILFLLIMTFLVLIYLPYTRINLFNLRAR